MNIISKLYFNLFKNVGNLRLMFVVSCSLSSICLLSMMTNPTILSIGLDIFTSPDRLASLVFMLYLLFWLVVVFYLPFLVVLPVKFIRDGYAQDKRNKK